MTHGEAPQGERSRESALGLLRDEVVQFGGVTVVRLAGELDLATAAQAGRALSAGLRRSTRGLVVDVFGLTFMDCSGLRVIVEAAQRLSSEQGGRLEVHGAAGIVRRVFELTGFAPLLEEPSHPTAEPCDELEAVRSAIGLSVRDLFVRYIALGGTADQDIVRSYLGGDACKLDLHQQDIAVHAINELAREMGFGDRTLWYPSEVAA